jgi:hypothetical protein
MGSVGVIMLIWTPQQSRVFQLDGGTITQISLDPADGFGQWGLIANTVGGTSATKGWIEKFQGDNGDAVVYTQAHEWTIPNQGFSTVYVRLTDTGSYAATGTTHTIDGTTWHTIAEDTTNVEFSYFYGGITPRTCSTLIEISLDSGGASIVQSGTYNITCSASP